jgi:glyoxylase-like metal-dependent hydrolase (beta-lactamase superfamily II)
MLGTQVAPWYRFKVGEFEATVVSDGPLAIGGPAEAFSGAPKEQLERDLAENFLSPDSVVLEQNALVVNTGRQLVLFDTGLGGLKLFGPTTGRLLANLKLAGIEPSQIDAVVLTHAHADHCFALIGETGQPNFPNARVYLAQADFDFWTDEAKASGALKPFVDGARANLLPLRDRTTFVADGKEVVPGVTALSAPGHTVGHTIYRVDSGRESVMFTGDISHHHVLLLKRPKLEFVYDTDPQLAARSRMRVLDMLATDRIAFVSYHFPFPGLGHVAKAGEGYVWHPSPVKTLL